MYEKKLAPPAQNIEKEEKLPTINLDADEQEANWLHIVTHKNKMERLQREIKELEEEIKSKSEEMQQAKQQLYVLEGRAKS